jgi:hypothetical protein
MKSDLTLDPVIRDLLEHYEEERDEQVQDYIDHPDKLPPFMDFKVDYAFKYILGHKAILMKLLNDILPVEVSDIEYLPNEIPVQSPKEKRAMFDVICTNRHTGEKFITEMQRVPDIDMDNRLLYYGCSLIHNQIKRGATTYSLKPVFVICIANYERLHFQKIPEDKFFFQYLFREENNLDDILTKNLQFFFLELPRLTKVWDSLETNLERWCYLFGNLNNFAKVPNDPAGFDEVFEIARTGELDKNKLKKYLASMLNEYDIYVIGEYYRREGIIQVAKAMVAKGMPTETIAEVTGLSEEAIHELQSPSNGND